MSAVGELYRMAVNKGKIGRYTNVSEAERERERKIINVLICHRVPYNGEDTARHTE